MSTSSGRAKEGNCTRCGHSMEQHQKLQFTKCQKCRKSFEVCQAGIHGDDGVRWRICYVPCSCGEKYYPLGLSRAHELARHKYQTSHEAYRPLTPDVKETIDEPGLDEVTESFDNMGIGESGPSSSSGSGHVRVDSRGTDELVWDQSAVKTRARAQPWSGWAWQPEYNRYYRSRYGDSGKLEYDYDFKTPGPATVERQTQPWSEWVWEGDCNRYYRSRAGKSGEWEYDYDYNTPGPKTAKGKGKRESGGSKDELAWDQSTINTRTWSKWIWEENKSCYYRSRLGDSGQWEYEYDYNTAGPAGAKEGGSRKGTGKGKEKRKK
jgi:hypothetical protein